jgi:membrane fusion protein (multidrug efflux system)
MKKYFVWLSILASGVLVLGCSANSKDPAESVPDIVLSVEAMPLSSGTVNETVSATGRTAVSGEEIVVSPVTGTVVSVNVKAGSSVKSGGEVAVIRTRDSEASITGAERLLVEAKTETQKENAQKALEVAQANQQLVPIEAQRQGTVAGRPISAGQTVAEGAELLRLIDLSTLNFIAEVKLRDVGSIRVGQDCLVNLPSIPGHPFPGQVAAIEPQTDINSQTVPVRIEFDSPAGEIEKTLRTDMRGTAEIVTAVKKDALLVPQAAIIRDDMTGKHHIFVISPDSLAMSIPVSIGVRTDSLVEIISPQLRSGMGVIVDGNYEASDSMRVTVARTARP